MTNAQLKVLEFLHYRQVYFRVTPSFDEIKDFLGLRSKSGIARVVTALESMGHIRKKANCARTLTVTKRGLMALGLKVCRSCGQSIERVG